MKYPLRLELNEVCGNKGGFRLEPGGGFHLNVGLLREPDEVGRIEGVLGAYRDADAESDTADLAPFSIPQRPSLALHEKARAQMPHIFA